MLASPPGRSVGGTGSGIRASPGQPRCFGDPLATRLPQPRLLSALLGGAPRISVLAGDQDWNCYAPLARLHLPNPRGFCEHLAALGIPNSVGTYALTACDQRPMFAGCSLAPCLTAASFIESLLAIVVTDHDDDERIHRYADVTQEAARWPDH